MGRRVVGQEPAAPAVAATSWMFASCAWLATTVFATSGIVTVALLLLTVLMMVALLLGC